MDLEVVSKNFPTVGDHPQVDTKGDIYEVQDGFPSVYRQVQPLAEVLQHPAAPQGPGPGLQPAEPASNRLPVRNSPSIPLGITSLGSRPPVME